MGLSERRTCEIVNYRSRRPPDTELRSLVGKITQPRQSGEVERKVSLCASGGRDDAQAPRVSTPCSVSCGCKASLPIRRAGAPDHPSWLRPHAPAPPNDLLFREPRFISPSLRREGWDVNIKRTHRIYNELGLQGKAFPKLQVNEHKVARARAPQWRTKSLSHSSEASPWPPHRVHVVDDFVLYFQAKQRAHCRRLHKRDYARVAVPSDAHTPAKLPLWTDDYCEFYSHFGLKLRSPREFMLLSA